MIRPILRYGESLLHQPASNVDVVDDRVQRLVDDMIETMYAAPGVGLAATQVGVPIRLFVIDLSVGRRPSDVIVMINPVFVDSKEKKMIKHNEKVTVHHIDLLADIPSRLLYMQEIRSSSLRTTTQFNLSLLQRRNLCL
jgi:peptide deformylase